MADLETREETFSIVELPLGVRLSLRLAPALAAKLGRVAGFPLDLPVNRSGGADGRLAARVSPDEWLLFAQTRRPADLADEVAAALDGVFHSLVDVSHRDRAIAVAGRGAREVLNGGCPLDLDDRAFPAGAVTRTIFGKVAILLWRPDAAPDFRVECRRSQTPYVLDFLREVGREF